MRKQAVRWFDGGASAACAVCARRAARTVARVERAPSPISVERCLECGSVRLVGSDDAFSDTDAVIDDYVEGGAGIDVIASGLCRAREGSVRRLLDVGCYYGFGVHVGARLFGWDAIGVEPTRAGARGRSELGVDIRSGSLDTVRDLGTFDLVLASEVVEHVTEPIDFLRRIRELLSPAGLLVLSTPAAEVVAPTRRDAEVLHALSPGNHRFLASARGLRTLLQRAGFGAFLVTRRDASLDAVAATSPEGLAAAVGEPALDRRRFMAYLDRTADEAPAGSALANGMASRHFREAVMQGDFAAADRSAGRMRDAMLARRGFDLSDPGSCADALREGLRPAWNLASAAYSSGIHQLVGRGAPELAAAYFDLGAGAAAAWTRVCDTVDVDTWNLRELSLGHRSIALARCRPGSCLPALERLGDVLDAREPGDARRIAWWTTRTCNELIAHGHLDVEPGLLGAAEQYAEPLARSNDVDYRRAGLDALFLLGVRALNTGTPTDARRWFRACSDACGAVSDRDEHARRLAAAAQAHDAMAGGLGGTAPTRPSGASGTPR